MNAFLLVSNIALWTLLLGVGFLLLGTLRSLGLLRWRLEELEATRPLRKGREGLPVGKQAPGFTLPAAAGGEISLSNLAGRRVLLVFTQSGCGPCHDIAPELNRLHQAGEQQVLVVNNGEPETAIVWAGEVRAMFPVVAQKDWSISKQYQVLATPYAFVIDEQGVIAAKGVASGAHYLRYVLDAAEARLSRPHNDDLRASSVDRDCLFPSNLNEVTHV
jgi:methylamine dehydrogenase accessory protein MauD